MNRKTLIAGAVFAGLILITIALLRSPEKGDRPAEGGPRPVVKLKAGDFDTLEVTKGGTTAGIKKEGDAYKLVKPVAYAADKDGVKAAFEALEKMEFATIISDQKTRHGEFEVGDGGLRLAVKKGDTTLADLHVGKTANDQTMVRVEGKDEVWGATGLPRYQFDKDVTAWRDKSIVTFDEKDAEKLEIEAKGGAKIALTKPAAGDGGAPTEWKVIESSVKVEPFDKTVASGLISQLSSWKANDFADSAKPEETGLDAPELKVTVSLKGGKQVSALVGKKKGEDDTYVKLADQPQVFLVKKYNLERIDKRPIEFREKTFCSLTNDEITEVAVAREKDPFTISKSGKEWKLVKPTGVTLDQSKTGAITSTFVDWKAQGFAVDNSPQATGLAKPAATITVKSTVKGHGCTLKVGSEASDKNSLYVAANGQPDVYVVPKWSVEHVLVKLDDLKKK